MARRKLKATTAAVTAAGAILLTFGTGTAQAAQVGNDQLAEPPVGTSENAGDGQGTAGQASLPAGQGA